MNWKHLTRYSIALSLNQCPTPDIEVKLYPGDAIFIPAMWFHWITTNTEEDSMNVAVNRWYDVKSQRDETQETPFCLECELGKHHDDALAQNKLSCRVNSKPVSCQEPNSLMQLWELEDENCPVTFQFKENTLNIEHLMQNTIPVHVKKSSTTQFASTMLKDVFPHLAQTCKMPLNEFFKRKDPHTYLWQCPIDGLDDIFGKSGSIPFTAQNLWVNFAEECESLCHCDESSNIILQIRGTRTIRLWRPCLRDQLVMRVPIPSNELCALRRCVHELKPSMSSTKKGKEREIDES
jgi:hypothetical protein